MANIRQARTLVVTALAVLLVLDAAAIGLLLSPLGRSRSESEKQYNLVRGELLQTRREVLPARDMDKKLVDAQQEIARFYLERMPAHYSDVSHALAALAEESGAQVLHVQYDTKPAGIANLDRLEIELTVKARYGSQVRLANALERSPLWFEVEGVSFGGKQEDVLQVVFRIGTYLKGGERGKGNETRS